MAKFVTKMNKISRSVAKTAARPVAVAAGTAATVHFGIPAAAQAIGSPMAGGVHPGVTIGVAITVTAAVEGAFWLFGTDGLVGAETADQIFRLESLKAAEREAAVEELAGRLNVDPEELFFALGSLKALVEQKEDKKAEDKKAEEPPAAEA